MKLIYQNFDGLDISFQGCFPLHILSELRSAKEEAQKIKKEVFTRLGDGNLSVMVAETGGVGGYAYRFHTGAAGETWFVSSSSNSSLWNVRVSISSLGLALHGYEKTKSKILGILEELEAQGDEHTMENGTRLKERISRVDYCFDFLSEGEEFVLHPERFVAHAKSSRSFYGKAQEVDEYIQAKGKVIETARIGKMPNRQVTIYNKTNEIKVRQKSYWMKIWCEANAWNTFPEEKTVWRVEVRAGKEELNKWNIKTFADFERKIGDAMKGILKTIRYVNPSEDTNTARWETAGFWNIAIHACDEKLSCYMSSALRKQIFSGKIEDVEKGYIDRIAGNLIGLAALKGASSVKELFHFIDKAPALVIPKLNDNWGEVTEKLQRASDKMEMLK